jgi:surface antigen
MVHAGRKALLSTLFFAVTAQGLPACAAAKSIHTQYIHSSHARRPAYGMRYGAHVIQCVAFAKQDAGIEISGNARDWWSNAAGIYERGQRPEIGSVLSFRANGRMPLGHVAVVAGMEDSRTITIDQAHWNSRGITRDIEVKDVSDNNDWSQVRVQLAHEGEFGSIYATHGFIYPRPDTGAAVEAVARTDYRGVMRVTEGSDLSHAVRHAGDGMEVAEAPVATRGLDLSLNGIASDAPDRDFR